MRKLFVLVCLAACDPGTTPPPSGTSVGNPGKSVFRVASGTGLETQTANTQDLSFQLVACDGTVENTSAGGGVDLIEGEALEFSGLAWCAVVVTVDQLSVTGVAAEGEFPFDLTLALPFPLTLWAAAPIPVDGESFVVELGAPGWISADGLGLGLEPVVVEPESELHDLLLLPLLEETAWYLDEDDDGEISAEERTAGPVAAAALPPPPEMSDAAPEDSGGEPDSIGLDGCNCSASGGPGAVPVLVGVALFSRRRRRR